MIYFILIIFLSLVLSLTQLLVLSQDFRTATFTTNNGIICGWNQLGATGEIQQCSDGYNMMSIYGATYFGQDVLIYKTFDIPSHYQISIQFQLWMYQYRLQQNRSYSLNFYVDDQVIGIITEADLIFSQNLCGDNFYDSYSTITFSTAHIGSFATVLIASTINQPITTWGIRDFVFSFAPCPDQCIQCQDSTSVCNFWEFQQEFWTAPMLANTEGWIYNIGSYQTIQCIGQNFIKINQIGDSLAYTIVTKPNNMFRIQFNLLKAGRFVNEQIIFSINTQVQYQQTFNNEQYFTQCSGITDGDQIISFSQDFLFTQFNTNILQLQFSSNVQQTSRFFGLRNFYLFIAPCLVNCLLCTTNNDCQQCDIDYSFDGVQCITTLLASPSIYSLYQSQSDIVLKKYTNDSMMVCGGLVIFRGKQQPNKIKFNITDMPFHNQMNIKINIVAIDKWDIQNTLLLLLDGQSYDIINRNKYDSKNRQILCGNNIWNDNQYEIDITLNHYSSFLIINLEFLLESLYSFGVLSISIDYYYCGPKYKCSVCDVTGTLCLQCSDVNRLLVNDCECTQSPGIQTSTCPDCTQTAENQMYCFSLYSCNRGENYLPYCQSCKPGFSYDSLLHTCVYNGQNTLDKYPQQYIYSIFSNPTYQDYNNIILYDISGIQLSNPVGSCGSQILLGGLGFNGKISMPFNNIPPYRRIRIKYILYLIDIDEGLSLNHYLNYEFYEFIGWGALPKSQQLCGSDKPEFVTQIDYLVGVSGDFNFQVKLSNLINQSLMGSFGIYDISVYYQPCADQIRCKTCDDNGCLTCSVPDRIQGPQCLCATYEYMNYAKCPTCPYKCQQNSCNQLGCLICANSQRGSPPDCLCSTYEIYGEPNCPLCQQNCLYCTQTMCLECSPGYYAYGEYCYQCPYQCETCLQNGCLTCSDSKRGSAPFCRCQTYEIIGQSTCPQCQQYCQVCDETGCLVCDLNRRLPLCECLSNYYEINNECIKCEDNCQTCDQYQCLTCHRSELILPYCLCPVGSVEVNSQCIFGKVVIKSYGYFDQSLKKIVLSFDSNFQVIGLDNQQSFNYENCVLIKNSQGICQIYNNKIIYEFASQKNYNLDDFIEMNQEYFYFLDKGNFEIQNVQLQLDTKIDYSPVFDLSYPFKILLCKQYLIEIENIINVGYNEYIIEVINEQSVNYNISNKTISFNSKIQGQLQFGIRMSNFVNKNHIELISILVVSDDNLNFEVLPSLGQLNRYFDLTILIYNIKIQNCMNVYQHNTTKLIDINFSDSIKLKAITTQSKYQFRINLGMLKIGQYTLNITISSQQVSNTVLKNYTISQLKPYFSILGGNRMIYYNNRLNVTALIVDPDSQGLICQWQCIKLESNQDCGFNFTSQQSQLIEYYQLDLYQTYQFIYDCLGNKVQASYYVTDLNQDQLYMLYPVTYSNHQQNQQNPIQYYVLNESNQNLLYPQIYQNISIRIIQNQSIIQQYYQENSFGQQYLLGLEGQVLIQAQLNQMVASINISLYKNVELKNISVNIDQGVALKDYFKFDLPSLNKSNPPYLYQYLAQINNQVTYQLSDWSQYSEQQFLLPQGRGSNKYSIKIILQIMNGNGFIQNISQSVKIQEVSSEINQIDQYLELLNNDTYFDNHKVTLGYQFIQLQEDGCLRNCSNNGLCHQNKCICQANFYLNDCSANQSQFLILNNKINQLLISLIQEDYSYASKNLVYQLLLNDYVYQNINVDIIEQIVNLTCIQLTEYINKQSIQNSDIDLFIKRIPQIDQTLSNYENQKNLRSLLKILDISFGLVGFDSPLKMLNSTQYNNYNMQLVNITKQFGLYMGLQQYLDQMPYDFEGEYINIISQKVSTNYSQKFFNNPQILKNQLDNSLFELQNESIISTVIYKTNPYLEDQNFPYNQINTQVASVQIYDSEGYQYRSHIPLLVSLVSNNSNINPVCIAQQGNQWISSICNTIRLTNKTLCNCDTIDQQSIVNDVNNLYSSSNLYLLIQIENFLAFDYQNSYVVIILAGFTICSFLFSYAGYKKDQIDVKQYNKHKQLRHIKQQIDYDSEEEEIILFHDVKRFRKRNIGQEIMVGLKKLHSFLRIYNEFSIDQPRPSRYVMFFLKQCILLSMTAIFGKGFSIIQNVFLSIMSIILITPIEKVIMVGFSFNASNKLKVLIQVFIIIVYISCWYVCVSVSAGVGTEKSNNWTFIFMLSFFINLTIIEALSIVLKILFSPFIDTFIQKGNCLARFVYFYLYDYQALAIVREINNYERPTILTTRE